MSTRTITQHNVSNVSKLAEDDPRIAVLIPCCNEAATIANVLEDFKRTLPDATMYVYDNNSKDLTCEVDAAAGAVVRHESRQGKGNVVRRMFADIDADIYVLVDGDDTYDAETAPAMIERLRDEQLDMVNGSRISDSREAFRRGHRFGNVLLTKAVAVFFGDELDDLLSSFRVFSRRFVKSFPALSSGFEIETELAVHALELRMPIAEVPTPYKERPPGSLSKLRTFRDGFRILKTICLLVKEERPLTFFGGVCVMFAIISTILAWPIFTEFLATGLVPRLPTAILSTGLMLLAFLSLACGLVLDTVTLGRREMKRMSYLAVRNSWRVRSSTRS